MKNEIILDWYDGPITSISITDHNGVVELAQYGWVEQPDGSTWVSQPMLVVTSG